MFVLLLIIESVADAQHFRFQEEKHTYSEALRKNHSNKVPHRHDMCIFQSNCAYFWCMHILDMT